MSGIRRVDCKLITHTKTSDKKLNQDEEINFQIDEIFSQKGGSKDLNFKEILTDKIEKENATKGISKFSLLNLEELNNHVFFTEEGKNTEEIKINEVEVIRCIKELEEASHSSIDDSQKSKNQGHEMSSIILKYIDNSVSIEEIEEFFKKCGEIKRISIMFDKSTGHPKGYAAVKFNSIEAKNRALELNNTLLKGKLIRVIEKIRRTPSYLCSKIKNFDHHSFQNNNERKYNYEQAGIAVPNSLFGPVKAKLVTRRNFNPY